MLKRWRGTRMPNRTMCDVLEEMRKACKVGNYSYMAGLIEEVQTMGNQMEAKLWDQKDLENAKKWTKEEEEKLEALTKEIARVKKENKNSTSD